MWEAVEQMIIGQRVQVIDGSLTQYGAVGTVMAAGTANDWYVQLDDDNEHSDAQILFHVEELQAAFDVAEQSRHEFNK